jgi:predicted Fe-Mo cluster-binding NifX family protein
VNCHSKEDIEAWEKSCQFYRNKTKSKEESKIEKEELIMSVRIAVGSSDGVIIDQHFGSGDKFYIFELLEDGTSKIVDTREIVREDSDLETEIVDKSEHSSCNGGGCGSGSHNEPGLLSKVTLLSDCDAVLVNQIGKSAEKLLLKNGISAFDASDSIEKAFSKLFIYYKRTKKL